MARSFKAPSRLAFLLLCVVAISACDSNNPDITATGPATVKVNIIFEGAGVADVQTILRDPVSGENLDHVASNENGLATLTDISPGTYRVLLSVPSFWRSENDEQSFADLDLTAGETVELEFRFVGG